MVFAQIGDEQEDGQGDGESSQDTRKVLSCHRKPGFLPLVGSLSKCNKYCGRLRKEEFFKKRILVIQAVTIIFLVTNCSLTSITKFYHMTGDNDAENQI